MATGLRRSRADGGRTGSPEPKVKSQPLGEPDRRAGDHRGCIFSHHGRQVVPEARARPRRWSLGRVSTAGQSVTGGSEADRGDLDQSSRRARRLWCSGADPRNRHRGDRSGCQECPFSPRHGRTDRAAALPPGALLRATVCRGEVKEGGASRDNAASMRCGLCIECGESGDHAQFSQRVGLQRQQCRS